MKSKRISMILAVLISASMLLAGCAGATSEPTKLPGMGGEVSDLMEDGDKDDKEAVSDDKTDEKEDEKEAVQEGAVNENEPFIPYISRNALDERDDNGMLFISNYDLISAGNKAEKYPELEKVLKKRNEDLDKSLRDEMEESLGYAAEYNETWDSTEGFWDNSYCYVQRADDDVFSYAVVADSFQGGAHGYVGTGGYNYDPKTGKEYKLSDIIKDEEELKKVLIKKLNENYSADIEWFEDLEKTFSQYGDNSDYQFNWFIEPYGVTFVFNPYELAAYAYGAQEVTISFDEDADLFTGKVGKAENGYAMRFPMYDVLSVDVDGDGKQDRIQVAPEYDYDSYDSYTHTYNYEGLNVVLNGKSLTDKEGAAGYSWDYILYLVCDKNGKYYIYVDTTGDNDWETLIVYSLSDGGVKKVDELSGNGIRVSVEDDEMEGWGAALFDPSYFEMGQRCDTISSVYGTRFYHISDDGEPVPETDYITITSDLTLKSSIELEAEYLGETEDITMNAAELKSTGTKETLPAGTEFKLWRSDCETYTDCLVGGDNGTYKVYRLYHEVNSEGFRTINGVELEDCFESLFFAG